MPKLIVRRVSFRHSNRGSFREDVLTAVRTLPGVISALPLLESDDAMRIEFSWKEPCYDMIEGHLNQHGLTSTG
ncbi:hypothetical protein [Lysobacter sp. Hz 25]|uniref:hypothetical protein n=1 Tax=Lysobacter sp. Hz 25 TaxID=3383698 RepID=UPI0038D46D1D